MSFVAARMQKMKSENLVGIGNHNQRRTKNHSNEDIDVEKSHLNYDLVDRTQNYKTDIETFINDKKASKRATRKDAVLVNEWIVTSDSKFFENKDYKDIERFFKETKNYFAKKFGDDNVRYAQVHLDERTPHMHLGIVPFDKDNKLSAKRVFNRQALQDVQDELPKHLQEHGFNLERGEKGSERKNLSVPEYKEMKERLKELNAEKEEIEQVLNTEKLPDVKIEPFMERKGLSLAKKPSETKITVNKDDLEQLQTLARANLEKNEEFERMRAERNEMKYDNRDLRLEVRKLEKENSKFKRQLKALSKNLEKVSDYLENKFDMTLKNVTDAVGLTSPDDDKSADRTGPQR